MNREIKFRAWDGNKFHYFTALSGLYGVLNPILMQYTGVRDENGKEIYEGDVVLNMDGDKRIVVYTQNSFEMRLLNSKRSADNMIWHFQCMVIGNIYENPELMQS